MKRVSASKRMTEGEVAAPRITSLMTNHEDSYKKRKFVQSVVERRE